MKRRFLSALTVAVLSSPVPALAYARDPGDDPGAGMSVLQTVAVFVVLPLAIWGVIWMLWSIPKWMQGSRPATAETWDPVPSRDVVKQ